MCRNSWSGWFYRLLTGAFILAAGAMYIMCSCIEANAEEIQVFREESGDLELLQGVELSELELEEGLANLKHSTQRGATQSEGNEEEYPILDLIMDIKI